MIIREFDNTMAQKLNKVTFKEFATDVQKSYVKKNENDLQQNENKEQIDQLKEMTDKHINLMEQLDSDLNRRIQTQFLILNSQHQTSNHETDANGPKSNVNE